MLPSYVTTCAFVHIYYFLCFTCNSASALLFYASLLLHTVISCSHAFSVPMSTSDTCPSISISSVIFTIKTLLTPRQK